MKQYSLLLAGIVAGLSVSRQSSAISLDDIQFWTGSGTNRAALVVEWSSPQVFNNSTLAAPLADKTLVWGFHFNGASTGSTMLRAVVAADPRLYVVQTITFGTSVEGFGYNLDGTGVRGITDGTATNYFTNRFLTNPSLNVDTAHPLNAGDLYWSGASGPTWELWNEVGDQGGLLNSPNRGTAPYWTPDDPAFPYSGTHGQWEWAQNGLDNLVLTNGSWIGFSVCAGGDNYFDDNDPGTVAFNFHKHAPPSPDGLMTAYVANPVDFATQVVSTNGVFSSFPYNDPLALLNRPTRTFVDHFGDGKPHRVKLIEAPYWTTPASNTVLAEIKDGGQVTVALGRRIYDDPNNPYGIDLIVYGNSFFSASGTSGVTGDGTDLNSALLSSTFFGHGVTVSVSQDALTWYAFTNTPAIFPASAFRWDGVNAAWTDEESNANKPVNPAVYGWTFGGASVASVLDGLVGSAGGTGYDLQALGLPWIQYVRFQPPAGSYAVIDAVAAVNPVVVGDALLITPDNLRVGQRDLSFQDPANRSQSQVGIHFEAINAAARISTIPVAEFSSLAPLPGTLLKASQVRAEAVFSGVPLTLAVDLNLGLGTGYTGDGGDLRAFAWVGSNWTLLPAVYQPTNHQLSVTGVTQLTTFAVAQVRPPKLSLVPAPGGYSVGLTPVPFWAHTLESSSDCRNWNPVTTIHPVDSHPVLVGDPSPVSGNRFYRVRLSYP